MQVSFSTCQDENFHLHVPIHISAIFTQKSLCPVSNMFTTIPNPAVLGSRRCGIELDCGDPGDQMASCRDVLCILEPF